jgi:hypothetical protein
MEKQLLYLMDYELGITEDELVQREFRVRPLP